MKGQLSMGINQHSNVNLQGFELLGFFLLHLKIYHSHGKISFLLGTVFIHAVIKRLGVWGFFLSPFIVTTKKADLVNRFTQL